VAGDYVRLVRPLSALRSLLGVEATHINEEWSMLHGSFLFLDDGIRVGLAVDGVSFTPRALPSELLLTDYLLWRVTEPVAGPWRTARVSVRRIGSIRIDFHSKGRGYRSEEWLNLPNKRRQREFCPWTHRLADRWNQRIAVCPYPRSDSSVAPEG
jgi:hypothetical protein